MLYPKLSSSRALFDLSGIWDFCLHHADEVTDADLKNPFKGPMTIAVPASYNDQKEGESFRDHYGWVLYRRSFSIPDSLKSQRVVLRFGAVTHTAKVYLNDKLLCEHKGGFLPFEVEITDFLCPDENCLTVAVDNRINFSTLPVGSEQGGNMLTGLIPELPGVTPKKQN